MSLWPFGKKDKKKEEAPKEEAAEVIVEETQDEPTPKVALEPKKEEQETPAVKEKQAPQLKEEKKEETNWLSRLSKGLGKSSGRLGGGIKQIFTTKKLDGETLEALEDLLISSDLGVKTAASVIRELSEQKYNKSITAEEVRAILAKHVVGILSPLTRKLAADKSKQPHVMLFCGVNGAGKTTTMGKFANLYSQQGLKVMVAACDTYRAAAVEQLKIWADRSGVDFVKGAENADPASVAYTAFEQAKKENVDVLLIDTAGRLQNKANLMEQLAKMVRVLKKIDDSAPHDTVIVLDATTGQNAHSQVKIFSDMVDVSGVIVTKLDGTAKGGVVVGLAAEYKLPIHAIGVGEGIEDLRHFDAESFAQELVGASLG